MLRDAPPLPHQGRLRFTLLVAGAGGTARSGGPAAEAIATTEVQARASSCRAACKGKASDIRAWPQLRMIRGAAVGRCFHDCHAHEENQATERELPR